MQRLATAIPTFLGGGVTAPAAPRTTGKFAGGMLAWQHAGKPITQPTSPPKP